MLYRLTSVVKLVCTDELPGFPHSGIILPIHLLAAYPITGIPQGEILTGHVFDVASYMKMSQRSYFCVQTALKKSDMCHIKAKKNLVLSSQPGDMKEA